jgi:hypothetical protein
MRGLILYTDQEIDQRFDAFQEAIASGDPE